MEIVKDGSIGGLKILGQGRGVPKLLHSFCQGYMDRDPEKIDIFMEEIFVKEDTLMIIDTSTGEFCSG